jgi:hypothetical protein
MAALSASFLTYSIDGAVREEVDIEESKSKG